MVIAYMERVVEVLSLGYRYCDPNDKNIKIRFAPKETCQRKDETKGKGESATVDWIDEDCVFWDKEYVVFFDPSFMVKVEDTPHPTCAHSLDLHRTVEIWDLFKDLLTKLPSIRLVREIDDAIGGVVKAKTLPPRKEEAKYKSVLERLKDLRDENVCTQWAHTDVIGKFPEALPSRKEEATHTQLPGDLGALGREEEIVDMEELVNKLE